MILLELLNELESQWRRLGAPIADTLHPGLDDARMDALTAPYGFHLPAELRTWWGWHNGSGASAVGSTNRMIGPGGFEFLSLEEALQAYEFNRRVHAEDDDEQPTWEATWLPFMSQGPQRLFMDCQYAEPTVQEVTWEWDRHWLDRAANLAQAVALWVWLLESDYYSWSDERRWECDFAALPQFVRTTGLV